MKARIYQTEDEQWIIADDDDDVEGPVIDIPDEVAKPMQAAQEQWYVASKAFSEWVQSQIEANGEDYQVYVTGLITESQWRARRNGCTHENVETIGSTYTRTECLDCGRRHYPEQWL